MTPVAGCESGAVVLGVGLGLSALGNWAAGVGVGFSLEVTVLW